ncbi:MAG: helix-turn-helix domain-containing protein [Bacteroidales bacterium]|nr:helix-turn-helix domain-containing protein [Bacteroidales bacterium]
MNFRIKEICKEKGVLFKDLAASLGITDVGLRQSLKGNPTIGTLERIACALGVPITDLFAPPAVTSARCPYCGKPIALTLSKEGDAK